MDFKFSPGEKMLILQIGNSVRSKVYRNGGNDAPDYSWFTSRENRELSHLIPTPIGALYYSNVCCQRIMRAAPATMPLHTSNEISINSSSQSAEPIIHSESSVAVIEIKFAKYLREGLLKRLRLQIYDLMMGNSLKTVFLNKYAKTSTIKIRSDMIEMENSTIISHLTANGIIGNMSSSGKNEKPPIKANITCFCKSTKIRVVFHSTCKQSSTYRDIIDGNGISVDESFVDMFARCWNVGNFARHFKKHLNLQSKQSTGNIVLIIIIRDSPEHSICYAVYQYGGIIC